MEKTYNLSYFLGCQDEYKEFLEKNILYIGLPELLGDYFNLHKDLTKMYLSKTNCGILINRQLTPINKNCDHLHFVCEDNTLIDSEGTKKNILDINKNILVITGGAYNNKIVKIYFIHNGFMVGDTHISFDNVYFCEYVSNEYGSSKYEIKFTPLLQHGFFSNCNISIQKIINRHNLKITNSPLMNEIKQKYYEDCEQAFTINCGNETIYVDKYLGLFFKDLSLIRECNHNINIDAFKQIVKCMKKLVVENKFPTEKELMSDTRINATELLHICNYFGVIDLLVQFFDDINLEK